MVLYLLSEVLRLQIVNVRFAGLSALVFLFVCLVYIFNCLGKKMFKKRQLKLRFWPTVTLIVSMINTY